MENKIGMFGKGVVENGVIKFIGVDGKGFIKSVSRPVVNETIKEEIVVENKPEIVLNVPEFMMNRKKPEPMGQLIVVNFSNEQEKKEVTADDIQEAFEDIMKHAKKKLKKFIKPVGKLLFPEENFEEESK